MFVIPYIYMYTCSCCGVFLQLPDMGMCVRVPFTPKQQCILSLVHQELIEITHALPSLVVIALLYLPFFFTTICCPGEKNPLCHVIQSHDLPMSLAFLPLIMILAILLVYPPYGIKISLINVII